MQIVCTSLQTDNHVISHHSVLTGRTETRVMVTWHNVIHRAVKGKGKGFPYSTSSVAPRADPGVQAVSLQVTVSHPPGGRLPLLSARPAVIPP